MKMILFGLVSFFCGAAVAAPASVPVHVEVARMTAYLNEFTILKEAFPAKVPGLADSERQKLSQILQSYGQDKMPHYTSYGNMVTAFHEDGTVNKMEIISFEPLHYVSGEQQFKFSSYEEYLKSFPARKVSRHLFFIENAFASERPQGGGGDPAVAAYHYKKLDMRSKRRIVNEKVSRVDSIFLGEGPSSEDEAVPAAYAPNESKTLSMARSILRDHPTVTCDSKNDKINANSVVTYTQENSVTKAKYKPTGVEEHLEFRKSQKTNESVFAICKNNSGECTEIDQTKLTALENSDRLTPSGEKKNKELAKALSHELRNADVRFFMPDATSSHAKFIKKSGIKYPNTTDISDLKQKVLSERNVDIVFKAYQQALAKENKSELTRAEGILERAAIHLKHFRAEPITKAEVKKELEHTLYQLSLSEHNPYSSLEESKIRYADFSFYTQVHSLLERVRPISDSSGKYSGRYLLTNADEKKYDTEHFRTLQKNAEEKKHAVKAVFQKIEAAAGEKENEKCRKWAANRRDDPQTAEYWVALCNIDALKKQPLISYSALGADLLNVANCCLNNTCKAEVVKTQASRQELRKGLK